MTTVFQSIFSFNFQPIDSNQPDFQLDLFIYLSHTISLWEKLKYHFYVFAYHGDHHFDYRDDHIVIIIVINMITELSPPVGPCGRPLEHVLLATFQ